MNREELLNLIYASRARLEAALEAAAPGGLVLQGAVLQGAAALTAPVLSGERSVKDLLAHIGWWEARAVEIYRELTAGRTPSYPISDDLVDEINARVLEDFRARDLDAVRAFERAAFLDLLNVVESASEADLNDPQRFAFTEGRPFYYWIVWNANEHFDEHAAELQALSGAAPAGAAPGGSALRCAGEFLAREGRDIDRAVYDYAFRGLPAAEVLDVLGRYQLDDGGFSGLEVDIAAPVANPFAADLALSIMTWIDPPRDHPVVQRAVAHLEATQDADGCWRFTPEVYEADLAPWFQGWQWPNLNPSGQIAGSLKQLGLGSDTLHARVDALFESLSKPEELASGEFFNVLPYAMLYQTEWETPRASLYRWGVVWWLVRQHVTNPELDATHFMEMAPRPDLAIARRLPQSVLNAKLDQLLSDQAEDGGWPTPYSPLWRPWITAANALTLKAFGRG